MIFPVFEVPLFSAASVLSAFFLFFSLSAYFVLGGSLFMVLLEHKAHRERNQAVLYFLQDWSRFFLLMSVILALGLGMGIWLLLGVLQPHSAVILARTFFWVWGIVWTLTLLEVAAALLYYSGWGVMSPGSHLAIGWVFVCASWISMFAVTGVQALMQNPVTWQGIRQFVNCFLTQTFNPSLLMQASLALGVAGLFSLVAGTMLDPLKLRVSVIRRASAFTVAGYLFLPLGLVWYAATLPDAARGVLLSSGDHGRMLFFGALALSVITFAFAATGPLNQPSGSPRSLALLLFGLGLLTAFTAGRIREVSRMPYMIRGKLFANGIPAAGRQNLDRSGFLRAAPYAGVRSAAGESLKAGEELFRFQCAGCHTMEGRRGIAKLVKGWSEEVLVEQLGRLDRMRGSMPPFMGTARERLALAKWLKYVTTERTANEGD